MPENTKNQDGNEIVKLRRQKLFDLQAEGKDPFRVTKFDQTHHSIDVRNNFDSLEVVPKHDDEGHTIACRQNHV